MNKKYVAEIVGWYGAFAILLAYALVSFKVIPSSGYLYQILNLTGAVGIAVISIVNKVKQPATLNIVWAIIAFVAIVSLVIQS
jgi:hypothetical protein